MRGCPPRSGVPARARLTARDSAATHSAAPSSWISGHAGTCQCPGTRKQSRAGRRHSRNWLIAWLAARCPKHGGGIPTSAFSPEPAPSPGRLAWLIWRRKPARSSAEFPDIKDPLETALAEAERFAKLAGHREVPPGLGHLIDGWRPAGEPLTARDVYGSRRLVMAPFSYDGGATDHWYAWDIDLCWIDVVVGAGVFASAEDALGEWREAVGPAASGTVLSSCRPGLTAQLLAPCLRTGPLADMLEGNEPRDLIREYYRLRRRTRDLTGSADAAPGSFPFDDGHAPEAFLNWYATRHDEVPVAVPEAAAIIHEEWGPHEYPDERSFYACSPHRIEMAAHLIRESYVADHANPALRLLPEWTQWCIERAGLEADAAARSREAARSAASALVHDDDEPTADNDTAPFRRQE